MHEIECYSKRASLEYIERRLDASASPRNFIFLEQYLKMQNIILSEFMTDFPRMQILLLLTSYVKQMATINSGDKKLTSCDLVLL